MLSPFNTISVPQLDDHSTILQTEPIPSHPNHHLVLTSTSLHLMDIAKSSLIISHVRDKPSSLEKYGTNEEVKLVDHINNINNNIAIVKTSKSFLLIYTLSFDSNANEEEVLTVYDKAGKLLQNGNLIEYKVEQFLQLNLLETPVYKVSLRLKMVLFIKNGIRDYLILSENHLLLITEKDQQLMNLKTSSMNLLNFGDGIKKIKLIGDDDLIVIKEDVVHIYPMKSKTGFKEFKEIPLKKIEDITAFNADLLLAHNGKELLYLNKSTKEIIKTLQFDHHNGHSHYSNHEDKDNDKDNDEIKQISISTSTQQIAILFFSNEVQILSKFGFKLQSIDSFPQITDISLSSSSHRFILATATELKHCSLWQSNHNYSKPILSNPTSSYLRCLQTSSLSLLSLPIPFENHAALNSQPLHTQSNDKFVVLAGNAGHFLLIYSHLDQLWDYFDISAFRKVQNIVGFKILADNDWILVNCDDEEILILDYFNQRLIYSHSLNLDRKDARGKKTVCVEVDRNKVLVYSQEKVSLFSYDSKSVKLQSVHNINLNSQVEKVIIWGKGYLILTAIGSVYEYDTATETISLLSQYSSSVEVLSKLTPDQAILIAPGSLHLLRATNQISATSPATLNITNLPAYPISLNLRKYQMLLLDDDDNNNSNNNTVVFSYLRHQLRSELQSSSSLSSSTQLQDIHGRYKDLESYAGSLEHILYELAIVSPLESTTTAELEKLKQLIELNEQTKIRIIANLLRKIEIKQCLHIFSLFNIDSKYLLTKSIEYSDYATLLNLLLIFLNFEDIDTAQLKQYLKVIYKEALSDDYLLKALFETLSFLKKFDAALLQGLIEEFEAL